MKARDRGMAESLADVLDQDPRIRAIVFAHNAHAGYAPFYESFTGGVVPLGRLLRDRHRFATLSIGAVYATGSTLLDPRASERHGGPTRTYDEPPDSSQAVQWVRIPYKRWLLDLPALERSASPELRAFLDSPPPGYFNNYGPAPPLTETYDLLVGYRRVHPAKPPPTQEESDSLND